MPSFRFERQPWIFAIAATAMLTTGGCSDDEEAHSESPQEEACEHLVDGPFANVTAIEATTDLPDVTIEHTSVGVALALNADGQYVGNVSFAAEETTEYFLMLDTDVPLMIFDRDGNTVEIESSESGQAFCSELAIVHAVDLEVGTYTLSFGPTEVTSFNMVHEEAGGEHSDHDDHSDHSE